MGITVATTRVAANTSTGEQDITTADLGGLTPKAVWLMATRAVTDGTAADGAGCYQGVSDGTLHVNHGAESEHNLDTTDTQTAFDAVAPPVLVIYDGTADSVIDGSADFVEFIADGVTINWSDAPSAGWLLTVVFFAGTDLSAAVFREGLGNTVDLATDITSIGFEADDVILPFLQGAPPILCAGLIHNDRAGGITQRSLTIVDRNGRATSELYASLRTDACIEEVSVGGLADWYGEASAFDSSGFTLTTRAAGGNSRSLCGIALRYGTSPVVASAVYTFSTPTGTGSNTDTGLGAEPQAVIYLTSLLEAAGSIASDSLAGSYGVAVITDGAQYHNTVSSEDNAGTSNTQSLSDNQAVNLPLHDGSAGMAATYSAFTSTGVTLSWSDVEAAAKLWPALAIGSGASGGITQGIGLASETDTPQPLNRQKMQAVGLLAEADSAQAMAASKTLAVGLLAEAGTVFSLTAVKTRAIGLVAEAETVFPLEAPGATVIGLVTEQETVFPLTAVKTAQIGLVAESDTVLALAAAKTLAVGLVTETETLFGLSGHKVGSLGLLIESDLVRPLTVGGQVAGSVVELSDTAVYLVELEDAAAYLVDLSDEVVYQAAVQDAPL